MIVDSKARSFARYGAVDIVKPNAAELAALRQVWLDNEVLYREGLALAVDKGDSAIRERVIFKALSVVDTGVRLNQLHSAQALHEFLVEEATELSGAERVLLVLPHDRVAGRSRWAVKLNNDGGLGHDWRYRLRAERVSDDDYWKDLSRRVESQTQRLLVAALSRSHNLPVKDGYPTDAVTFDWARRSFPEGWGYFVDHRDGFRT